MDDGHGYSAADEMDTTDSVDLSPLIAEADKVEAR